MARGWGGVILNLSAVLFDVLSAALFDVLAALVFLRAVVLGLNRRKQPRAGRG